MMVAIFGSFIGTLAALAFIDWLSKALSSEDDES